MKMLFKELFTKFVKRGKEMENINTASNLAQLIMGLPNTLWSLPVFYEDCDCGYGPHPVNSLYPDRDSTGNIYLRPSGEHFQVTDILAEYNRLKKDNEDSYKKVEIARAHGVEVINYDHEPFGWRDVFPENIQIKCNDDFDPNKPEDAEQIIMRVNDTLMMRLHDRSDNSEPVWGMFKVGYPGSFMYCRYILDKLDVQMKVIDAERQEDDLIGDFLHMKLHFDIQFDWVPDVEHDTRWKELGYKYNHREVYRFDNKAISFEIIKSNPT